MQRIIFVFVFCVSSFNIALRQFEAKKITPIFQPKTSVLNKKKIRDTYTESFHVMQKMLVAILQN